MAQNIALLGSIFPNVPAVVLPTAEGGEAEFVDISAHSGSALLSGSDLLEGVSGWGPYGEVMGTMPEWGAEHRQITAKAQTEYFPEGHYVEASVAIDSTEQGKIIPENIKQGVTILGVAGSLAPGGSSLNTQIAQSTTRATSTSYTELVSLTCSKTGTYDIYWTGFRSSTSGSWGSQLYINNSAYGSAQSTFTYHVQNVHLTGVSLTAGQEVAVRARSRGSNYYAYVSNLIIVQTA